jgi:hypothetical protein
VQPAAGPWRHDAFTSHHPGQTIEAAHPDNFGTLDDLFGLLKDNLGKADAFITSAEYQLEQAPSGDEDEDDRRRLHVEHLVEAAKYAVRAAGYTAAEIDQRRQRDA